MKATGLLEQAPGRVMWTFLRHLELSLLFSSARMMAISHCSIPQSRTLWSTARNFLGLVDSKACGQVEEAHPFFVYAHFCVPLLDAKGFIFASSLGDWKHEFRIHSAWLEELCDSQEDREGPKAQE